MPWAPHMWLPPAADSHLVAGAVGPYDSNLVCSGVLPAGHANPSDNKENGIRRNCLPFPWGALWGSYDSSLVRRSARNFPAPWKSLVGAAAKMGADHQN